MVVCSPEGTLTQSSSATDLTWSSGISRQHSSWCPVYVESEQTSLNTTEMTRQQCDVIFGRCNTCQRPDVSSCVSLAAGPRYRMDSGCGRGQDSWDERNERNSSEVGADDGTAKIDK